MVFVNEKSPKMEIAAFNIFKFVNTDIEDGIFCYIVFV